MASPRVHVGQGFLHRHAVFDGIDVVIYFRIASLHFGGLFLFLSLFLFPLGWFWNLPEKGFSCFGHQEGLLVQELVFVSGLQLCRYNVPEVHPQLTMWQLG